MTPNELLIIHFEETRRRSLLTWTAIPPGFYHWRPDKDAMTLLEIVRHVLESEHLYQVIMESGGLADGYDSPWDSRPCLNVEDELNFAAPFRKAFLAAVNKIPARDLTAPVIRPDLGQKSFIGKYLLKVAYHEAVHTGQLLAYIRTLGIEKPLIWD